MFIYIFKIFILYLFYNNCGLTQKIFKIRLEPEFLFGITNWTGFSEYNIWRKIKEKVQICQKKVSRFFFLPAFIAADSLELHIRLLKTQHEWV